MCTEAWTVNVSSHKWLYALSVIPVPARQRNAIAARSLSICFLYNLSNTWHNKKTQWQLLAEIELQKSIFPINRHSTKTKVAFVYLAYTSSFTYRITILEDSNSPKHTREQHMWAWLPRGYIGIPHTISNPSLPVCANDVPARQGTTECVTYMLSPML
jgi:hypothetical protein